MRREEKLYFRGVLIILATSIIFSVLMRFNFSNKISKRNLENIGGLEYSCIDNINFYNGTYDEFINREDMINKSNLIVRGKKISQKVVAGAVLSSFKVNSNLKGESSEVINVYEPIEFGELDYVSSPLAYNLMNDKDEYILFLKNLVHPKNVDLNEILNNTFTITNPLYGKINTEKLDYSIISIEEICKKSFNEIFKNEIVFLNEESKDKYINLRNEMIKE